MEERRYRETREIPRPPTVEVQTEDETPIVSNADQSLIQSLRIELESTGVLDRDSEISVPASSETIDEIFASAASSGQGEDVMNSDYHDPRVEELLKDLEGIENPLFQDSDDYDGLPYMR